MPRAHRAIAAALAISLAAPFGTALADAPAPTKEQVKKADELFALGNKLLKEDKLAEACAAFEQSMQLAPATGTAINVADCHEAQGRVATAFAEWQKALAMAEAKKNGERIKKAKAHIAALEPKLSYLTVLLPGSLAGDPSLAVLVDDNAVEASAYATARAVDPGVHFVEVRAKGRVSWRGKVVVAPEADKQTVAVPELEKEKEPAPATSAVPTAPVKDASAPLAPAAPPRTDRPQPAHERKANYIPGIVVASVGVVALGFAGVMALQVDQTKNNTAQNAGANGASNGDARTQQLIGQIGLGVGVAATGVGLFLLIVPPKKDVERAVGVAPLIAPSTGGVSVFGRF